MAPGGSASARHPVAKISQDQKEHDHRDSGAAPPGETADKVFCEGGPRSFPVCYLGNCLLRRVHEDLPSSPGAVAKAD